jgi:hypothetical protein
MNITLSPDVAGDRLLIPNIVRAVGQALMLTPVSAITTAGIGPSNAGPASGLSNMLRNLGGAIGTAVLATILTKREQFHSNIIGQSVTLYRDEVRQHIVDLTSYFQAHGVADPAGMTTAGYSEPWLMVTAQAGTSMSSSPNPYATAGPSKLTVSSPASASTSSTMPMSPL